MVIKNPYSISFPKAKQMQEDYDVLYNFACDNEKEYELAWSTYQKILDEGVEDILKILQYRDIVRKLGSLFAAVRYRQIWLESKYLEGGLENAINKTKKK